MISFNDNSKNKTTTLIGSAKKDLFESVFFTDTNAGEFNDYAFISNNSYWKEKIEKILETPSCDEDEYFIFEIKDNNLCAFYTTTKINPGNILVDDCDILPKYLSRGHHVLEMDLDFIDIERLCNEWLKKAKSKGFDVPESFTTKAVEYLITNKSNVNKVLDKEIKRKYLCR